MNAEWYCVIDGQRRGPMTWDELCELARSRALAPSDLVWEPSFGAAWRKASTVDGLIGAAAAVGVETAPVPPDIEGVSSRRPATPLTGVTGARPYFFAAVRESWDVMKSHLFKPFDLARWFGIGFCAWIAAIGGDGCQGRLSFSDTNLLKNGAADAGMWWRNIQGEYQAFMNAHANMAPVWVAVVALAVLLLLAWALVATWLRSRGAFMLVHRWHHPQDTVRQAWKTGRGLGRSLFLWRVTFGLTMTVLLLGLLGALLITAVMPYLKIQALPPGGSAWIWGLGFGLLLVICCWFTISVLLDAFVIPVMYWRQVGVLDAWRVVWAFCNQQPMAVLIYLAFLPLLALASVLALAAVVLGTCGLFCLPLLFPYLNRVALLPMTLFWRGLSICFIRQWRPDL